MCAGKIRLCEVHFDDNGVPQASICLWLVPKKSNQCSYQHIGRLSNLDQSRARRDSSVALTHKYSLTENVKASLGSVSYVL